MGWSVVLGVLFVLLPDSMSAVIHARGTLSGLVVDMVLLVVVVGFWLRMQGTPGKLLMNCRVVDANTHATITLRQGIIRYIGYFVSLITLCLGFLWVAWDARKQGFHDKLAGTVVIMEDESTQSLEELMRGHQ